MVLCCCDTAPPPPTGACCTSGGFCTENQTESECEAAGGVWQGQGTDCSPNPCPTETQACCYPDGTCIDRLSASCLATGGTPQGAGTNCAGVNCPQPTGACCASDGTCTPDQTEADCIAAGNVWQGAGTVCNPNPCPIPQGACCETSPPFGCTEKGETACLQQGLPGDFIWTPGRQCADVDCECSDVVGFGVAPASVNLTMAVPSLAFDFALYGVSQSSYNSMMNVLNSNRDIPFLSGGGQLCVYNSGTICWPDAALGPTYELCLNIDVQFETDGADIWVKIELNINNAGSGPFAFKGQQAIYWSDASPVNPNSLFGAYSTPGPGTNPAPGAPAGNYFTQSNGLHTFPPQPIVGQGTINVNAQ